VNENNSSTMSFDRMRNMLNRAAEVRESEQQQIFDALDEIHARLQPVESLGAVRKRLSELPDRTEVSVLAERLDEALAKLEAQDSAIGVLGRSVDSMVDKLAKPFAQLDGRLDGMSGRFEGVAGRMDGLEDKLSHIHKRIDDVDGHLGKQDGKLDALPREVHVPLRERLDILETALRGRVDEVGEGVHEHLDGTREALYRSVTESTAAVGTSVDKAAESLHGKFTQAHDTLTGKLDEHGSTLRAGVDAAREALHTHVNGVRDDVTAAVGTSVEQARASLDPTDRLLALTDRLEQVTSRLDAMAARIDAVESGIGGRLGELSTSVEQGLHQVRGTVSARPDTEALVGLVRGANEESERRHAGQLDEAMATFAELILGGGAPSPPPPPTALPRQQRRARGPKNGKTNGKEPERVLLAQEPN
jgi:ABC-type transporter Mla subunit MlaD